MSKFSHFHSKLVVLRRTEPRRRCTVEGKEFFYLRFRVNSRRTGTPFVLIGERGAWFVAMVRGKGPVPEAQIANLEAFSSVAKARRFASALMCSISNKDLVFNRHKRLIESRTDEPWGGRLGTVHKFYQVVERMIHNGETDGDIQALEKPGVGITFNQVHSRKV